MATSKADKRREKSGREWRFKYALSKWRLLYNRLISERTAFRSKTVSKSATLFPQNFQWFLYSVVCSEASEQSTEKGGRHSGWNRERDYSNAPSLNGARCLTDQAVKILLRARIKTVSKRAIDNPPDISRFLCFTLSFALKQASREVKMESNWKEESDDSNAFSLPHRLSR